MDPFGVVLLCLLAAFLLVGARKKKGKPFLAILTPGKDGMIGIKMSPVRKKRRRKR